MSNSLIARMRKNRELKVTVGKFVFNCRRPTDVEAIQIYRGNQSAFDQIAAEYVIGWEGVTDNDIVGGGGTDPTPFDATLWAEWCADHPEFWGPIATAVMEAYTLHRDAIEGAQKN